VSCFPATVTYVCGVVGKETTLIAAGKVDVVVRLDEALKARLAERARGEGRSLANLIAYAAAVYLEKVEGKAA
jgi:hypothetical protein